MTVNTRSTSPLAHLAVVLLVALVAASCSDSTSDGDPTLETPSVGDEFDPAIPEDMLVGADVYAKWQTDTVGFDTSSPDTVPEIAGDTVTPCDGHEDCPDGTFCGPDGLCVPWVCEPSSVTCEADEAITCDEHGASFTGESCADDNQCTSDACVEGVGCTHDPVSGGCDDGDPCTQGEQCQGGECTGGVMVCEPCASDDDCVAYEDDDLCNGSLYCDTTLEEPLCVVDPATVVECGDAGAYPCLTYECVPSTGLCALEPINEGGACDDDDPCTEGDACMAGVCLPGVLTTCNDDNPCTSDACIPGEGCTFEPSGGACDDGDVCTQGDSCSSGVCQPGVDICDECVTDDDCAALDDADLCNGVLVCNTWDNDPGQCEIDPSSVVVCTTDSPCLQPSCDPLTGTCGTEPADAGSSCDDGDPCTVETTCQEGTGLCGGGMALSCDDGNPCTDDVCLSEGGCTHQHNTAPCDDGNDETVGDHCLDGLCIPGEPGVTCASDDDCLASDDGNLCNGVPVCNLSVPEPYCMDDPTSVVVCDTTADTDCMKSTCQPQTGLCIMVSQADGTSCDDLDDCTSGESCQGGVCQGGEQISCDDGNPCTADTCDPVEGCVFTMTTDPCEDGDPCTSGDTCADGVCVPGDDICQACATDDDCLALDDDDLCNGTLYCDLGADPVSCKVDPATVITCDPTLSTECGSNVCDPATGTCGLSPINEGQACSDADACTSGTTCGGGVCGGGAPTDCDDNAPCTVDSCDPELGCVHEPMTIDCPGCETSLCSLVDDQCLCECIPLECDDDDACTDDYCHPTLGECVHDVVPCNDGDPCTVDSCDPVAGCVYQPQGATCGACETASCTSTGSTCNCTCIPKSCDDDDPCTTDACDAATGACLNEPVDCDDGNPCTADQCDAALGCVSQVDDTLSVPCYEGPDDTEGVGQCAPGAYACVGGVLSTTCQGQILPGDDDDCDGVDDDCNGTTDDLFTMLGDPCDGNDPDGCQEGHFVCTSSGLGIECDESQVGYLLYPLNEGTGAAASSATAIGPTATIEMGTWVDGIDGQAVNFYGTGGFVGIPDGSYSYGAGHVEIMAWINPQFVNSQRAIVEQYGGFYLQVEDGKLCWVWYGTSPNTLVCTADAVITANEWQHVAALYDGSTIRLYKDGLVVLAEPHTGAGYDKDTCIGVGAVLAADGSCTHYAHQFLGSIDEVYIGFGAITEEDVLAAYALHDGCNGVDDDCDGTIDEGGAWGCEDGFACTSSECVDSACVVVVDDAVCDDGDACTTDYCDADLGCVHEVLTSSCGACEVPVDCVVDGTGSCICDCEPLICDDGDACTDDVCDPTVGGCVSSVVACAEDSFDCTTASCDPAVGCVFLVDDDSCDDGNVCTDSYCDAAEGCVVADNEGPCDDGDACTMKDTCDGGACAGEAISGCGCAAVQFDGNNDYVDITSSGGVYDSESWTVDMWLYVVGDATDMSLFAIGEDPSTDNTVLQVGLNGQTGIVYYYFEDAPDNNYWVYSTEAFPKDAWHHLAVQRSGTTVQMYFDGVLVTTDTTVYAHPGIAYGPILIGAFNSQQGGGSVISSHFEGIIDEFRFSSSPRYGNGGFTPPLSFVPDEDTLILYHFDEGSGSDVYDSSMFVNDASLEGAVFVPETPGATCVLHANQAPRPFGVNITPANPDPGAEVTCEVIDEALDPDGNQVTYTYSWALDGVTVPGATGATLPAGTTENTCASTGCGGCQKVTCTATATDPFGASTTASSSDLVSVLPCSYCPSDPTSLDSSVTGHCYRYFNTFATWGVAAETCATWGGHLVTITSWAEEQEVETIAFQHTIWLGLSDNATEGEFEWVTGETYYYNNFSPSQPNDPNGTQDCVQKVAQPSPSPQLVPGTWNDTPCGASNPAVDGFVCEK